MRECLLEFVVGLQLVVLEAVFLLVPRQPFGQVDGVVGGVGAVVL